MDTSKLFSFGSVVGVAVLITSVHQLLTYSAFSGRGLSINIEEINLCGDTSLSRLKKPRGLDKNKCLNFCITQLCVTNS